MSTMNIDPQYTATTHGFPLFYAKSTILVSHITYRTVEGGIDYCEKSICLLSCLSLNLVSRKKYYPELKSTRFWTP